MVLLFSHDRRWVRVPHPSPAKERPLSAESSTLFRREEEDRERPRPISELASLVLALRQEEERLIQVESSYSIPS